MKIIFIGCVESSLLFLKSLLREKCDVVAVITMKESKYNADYMDLTPLCEEYKIPMLYVKNINEEKSISYIRKRKADIGFCMGWSQLVSEDIINLFPRGMVGYHPAELPYNRGRHPIIWALALGLEETASTFFMIEKSADSGAILSQEKVEILYEDNAETLMNKLLHKGEKQVVDIVHDLEQGNAKLVEQNPNEGNTWRKRGKIDGQIDWRMSSNSIYNLVRALYKPYVGAHLVYKNKEYKVWKVSEIKDEQNKFKNIEPGKVLYVTPKSFVVKAGEDLVEVLESDLVEVTEGQYLQ